MRTARASLSQSPRSAERKRTTYVSGTFCYYISGRSNLSGQFQMLSCQAAQGKDLSRGDVMELKSIRQATVWAAALGLCGIVLASAPAARAQERMRLRSRRKGTPRRRPPSFPLS